MRKLLILAVAALLAAITPIDTAEAAESAADQAAACEALFGEYAPAPTSEPLAACQWNMAMIGANDATFDITTGDGVLVGVLDSGVDMFHPDIAPNLDVDLSCSFIYDHDPFALDVEKANGDCSNKAAVQDYGDHGTHVASTIAAPINGIGIAGVAPDATIVGIKVCSAYGYCFADSVAAGIRYAGDIGLDVVNLSLYADPWLYYCGNDAEQRAILRELQGAVRYAQQQGVLIVSSAGNGANDLQHPTTDTTSPNYPEGEAYEREIRNNCRVAPTELTGVVSVMSTGPIGYPGYGLHIADYSTVGGDVAAPGGDYFQATGTVHDAILAGMSSTSDPDLGNWYFFDFLNDNFYPGLTSIDADGRYAYLNGTSMASPHVAGVAALIIERYPDAPVGAIRSALQRSADATECPESWEPLNDSDTRYRCYGGDGHTSFFGHGVVSAAAAATVVID